MYRRKEDRLSSTSFSLDLNAMKTPPPIPLILTLWKADDPLHLLSFDFDAKKRDWPSTDEAFWDNRRPSV